MVIFPAFAMMVTGAILGTILWLCIALKYNVNDDSIFGPGLVVSMILVPIILATICEFRNTPEDIVKMLQTNNYKIQVISDDKAFLFKEGSNNFSYIEIETKKK